MAPTVERGEYLARYVCNCVGCHTKRDMMTYEAIGPEFAGGMEFEPWPELAQISQRGYNTLVTHSQSYS
jgi:mono/diheme cytochrome c family protein